MARISAILPRKPTEGVCVSERKKKPARMAGNCGSERDFDFVKEVVVEFVVGSRLVIGVVLGWIIGGRLDADE